MLRRALCDIVGANSDTAAAFVDGTDFGVSYKEAVDSNMKCMIDTMDGSACDASNSGECVTTDPCQQSGFSCPLCVSADTTKQAIFVAFGKSAYALHTLFAAT